MGVLHACTAKMELAIQKKDRSEPCSEAASGGTTKQLRHSFCHLQPRHFRPRSTLLAIPLLLKASNSRIAIDPGRLLRCSSHHVIDGLLETKTRCILCDVRRAFRASQALSKQEQHGLQTKPQL